MGGFSWGKQMAVQGCTRDQAGSQVVLITCENGRRQGQHQPLRILKGEELTIGLSGLLYSRHVTSCLSLCWLHMTNQSAPQPSHRRIRPVFSRDFETQDGFQGTLSCPRREARKWEASLERGLVFSLLHRQTPLLATPFLRIESGLLYKQSPSVSFKCNTQVSSAIRTVSASFLYS